jgi:SAM-dependent methyltransferase
MASHFFQGLAEFMGPAYLRYSFTKGTVQEVAFLTSALSILPGSTILDVGCGPGRHSLEFARRGMRVTGVDISEPFVVLGNAAARAEELPAAFLLGDARSLTTVLPSSEYDLVLSLCQGGFGLVGRTEDGSADATVLNEMAALVAPGGRLVLSAFSAYFQLRHLEKGDSFDAATGVNHERTEIRSADGTSTKEVDLWTTCFTPLELRLLAERAGLVVEHLWSVTPGDYAIRSPLIDHPEFLLVCRRARSSLE